MNGDLKHLIYAVVLIALGVSLHKNLQGQAGMIVGTVLYILGGFFLVKSISQALIPKQEVVVQRVPYTAGYWWNPGWWGGVYRAPPIRRWRRRRWRRRFR